MNEKTMLLNRIRTASFLMQEAALYLDTHPRCGKALRYYNNAAREREEALRAYEAKYGMLCHAGGTAEDCWQWVAEPWPWEG